jgi:hypothetical protein
MCIVCCECLRKIPKEETFGLLGCNVQHRTNLFFHPRFVDRCKKGGYKQRRRAASKSPVIVLGKGALILVYLRKLYARYDKELMKKIGKRACELRFCNINGDAAIQLLHGGASFNTLLNKMMDDPMAYVKDKVVLGSGGN